MPDLRWIVPIILAVVTAVMLGPWRLPRSARFLPGTTEAKLIEIVGRWWLIALIYIVWAMVRNHGN